MAVGTIGVFDGVHRGHQYLLRRLCDDARQRGWRSVVVTFDRHPREVLQSGWHPELLTTLDERLQLLKATGIDECVVLPFTHEMAAQSAQTFMRETLLERLHIHRLSIGYDHRFGHDRAEGFEQYVHYGRDMGMEVVQNDAFCPDGQRLSSSVIRHLLHTGDVDGAATCLGREYSLCGTVVGGEHVGRTLGFPTANLRVDHPDKIIPAPGVYAVHVFIDGTDEALPAMMNIGTRPTYGPHDVTLEVHILDFSGDLYGHQLTVAFASRLRDEQPFTSGEALRQQLSDDARAVREELCK